MLSFPKMEISLGSVDINLWVRSILTTNRRIVDVFFGKMICYDVYLAK